ncbi:MAG: ThiF family adenylyltransferase, partial [Candidatus Competibacteraceae bacterium]|nr:ThiF family adenylyltransferase [Candidatus Competibacteraceae bacterium]
LHSTLGRPKIEVMAERLHDIDPTLELTLIREFLQPERADALIAGSPLSPNSSPIGGAGSPPFYDYVADCIDSIACKAALVAACHRHGAPVISALGAGNCLDVRRVRVTMLDQTQICPLARELRRQMRKQGASLNYPVIYSDEPRHAPLPHQPVGGDALGRPRAVNGTISYMPALFGVMLAGVIVRELLGKFNQDADATIHSKSS